MYANIINTCVPNDCSMTDHLPFLVCGGVRATTGKLRPRNCPPVCKTLVFVDFWGFFSIISGVAHKVKPHPDYWTRVTGCDELASNRQRDQQWVVSRNSTIVFSTYMYLALKTNSMQPKTPLCIWIPFGCPQHDSICFQRGVAVTSNHLNTKSV